MRSFRRDITRRFDNAEEMLREWRQCFEGLDDSGRLSDHADEADLRELLAEATFDTHIPELGLGTRATNALDFAAPPMARWFRRVAQPTELGPLEATTRLTCWIDRADMSKTVSHLYAPTKDATSQIPKDAWTVIEPNGSNLSK